MNRKDLFEEIKKQPFWHEKLLDPKENHTTKKVELLRSYMDLYIQVQAHRDKILEIDFIDAMCNAGIYSDGDLCTSMEVLDIFIENAARYANIHFSLFINDIDPDRVKCSIWIFEKIIAGYDSSIRKRISLHTANKDVNEYLSDGKDFPKSAIYRAQVAWLDPYNFGTIKIDSILDFLRDRYCELFYNVFTSDFSRNYVTGNIPTDKLDIDIDIISDTDKLMQWIQGILKVAGEIQYCFAYPFHNLKNVEMYKILFATPNIAGLRKFKEVLFNVFEGHPMHSNRTQYSDVQPSLFGEEETKMYAEEAGQEAIKPFLDKFAGKEIGYSEIELFILESTILPEHQIIENFIKPMVRNGYIMKMNKEGLRNYKKDMYRVRG